MEAPRAAAPPHGCGGDGWQREGGARLTWCELQ